MLEKAKNNVIDYQYNNLNQLTKKTIKKDITTYSYDKRGNWDRLLYVHEDAMGNTMHYTKATGQSFGELQYAPEPSTDTERQADEQ